MVEACSMTNNSEKAMLYLKESAELAETKPETLIAVETLVGR